MSYNVQHLPPSRTGFNNTAIDVAADGVEIDCEGQDGVTLFFDYTRSGATGNITWEIHRRSRADGQYYPLNANTIVAGVATFTKYVGTKATASASQKWSADYTVTGYDRFKIMQVTAAGGAPVPADTMSISVSFWSQR